VINSSHQITATSPPAAHPRISRPYRHSRYRVPRASPFPDPTLKCIQEPCTEFRGSKRSQTGYPIHCTQSIGSSRSRATRYRSFRPTEACVMNPLSQAKDRLLGQLSKRITSRSLAHAIASPSFSNGLTSRAMSFLSLCLVRLYCSSCWLRTEQDGTDAVQGGRGSEVKASNPERNP
jgi:hypothetical protein